MLVPPPAGPSPNAEGINNSDYARPIPGPIDAGRVRHGHVAPAPQRIRFSSWSTNPTSWDRGTKESPPPGPNDGTGPTPAGSDDRYVMHPPSTSKTLIIESPFVGEQVGVKVTSTAGAA